MSCSSSELLMDGCCSVCTAQANYTCPRCQSLTCSLTCYQSHNHDCLEVFSQEQVSCHLRASRAGHDQKAATVAMLESDRQATWDPLESDIDEEPSSFSCPSFSSSTSPSSFSLEMAIHDLKIRPFKPWWTKPAISPHSPTSSGHPLPKASQLSGGSSAHHPSRDVLYAVVEALYSYVLILRLWNGDLTSEPAETFFSFSLLAQALSHKDAAGYASGSHVVHQVQSRAALPPVSITAPQDHHAAVSDLIRVWQHITFVGVALRKVFQWGARAARVHPEWTATVKKLFFYRCWAGEHLLYQSDLQREVLSELKGLEDRYVAEGSFRRQYL